MSAAAAICPRPGDLSPGLDGIDWIEALFEKARVRKDFSRTIASGTRLAALPITKIDRSDFKTSDRARGPRLTAAGFHAFFTMRCVQQTGPD
jgi:hypothetical protein